MFFYFFVLTPSSSLKQPENAENALKNVYCDTAVGDDFKQGLSSLFPEEKSGYAEYFGQGHWRRED